MGEESAKFRPASLPSPTLADDIFRTVRTIVIVADGEGRIVYVSPAVERILGYPVEEVLGDGWWTTVHGPDVEVPERYRQEVARIARGEVPVAEGPYRKRMHTKSGEERWILWHDAKGPGNLLIGAGQDVTRLKRAEDEIEHRQKDFRAIFEGASDGMLILNSDWVYVDANPAASRIFGLPVQEIVGREHGTLLGSTLNVKETREKAVREGTYTDEVEFSRSDGHKRQVEVTVNGNFRPGQHLILMRDITDRRGLERQLAQAQKLEAVGRLAGGVAHDFNNMLTAIRGYGDLALKKYPEGGHRRYVEGILNASERAAQTTQHLLAFSRRQVMQPRLLNLNRAITELLDLLRRVIGEDIELVTLLSKEAELVMVDPGQFEQILMNLAVNARDAMPAGGKLIIETRSVYLDDEYVLRHIQVEPGDFTMLAVTDTGSGIPPEVRPHIFEPFFTTKPVGRGTGLGLSTVYGVVKQSGGYIWVYSEPGEGTTFKIYLPKADSPRTTSPVTLGRKTILLIEDDEMIRSLAATALRERGHEVLEAPDGRRALEICQEFDRQINLVITDIGAPGMSGEDLMGFFAIKYPEVAIVHMSGFSLERLRQANILTASSHFLGKPFTVQELLEIVQRALEPRQAANTR